MTEQTNELSDYEKTQMAEEGRRAKVYAQAQADEEARRRDVERHSNIARMSTAEFDRLRREEFAKTEARRAAREAKKQQG